MNVVRVVGRIALWLLVLGLCAVTVYGLWRFVRVHWPAVLFYGYLTPAALMLVVGLIVLMKQVPPGLNSRDRLLQMVGVAADESSRLTKMRRVVGGALDGVSNVVTWPVHVFSMIGNVQSGSVTNSLANLTLHSPQVKRAVFSLAMVGAVTFIDWRSPAAAVYGTRLLYIVIVSIICRHLSYVVGTNSLPQILRRSQGNSYLRFLGITTADFGAYVIAFSTILPTGPAQASVRYRYIAQQIFAFHSVRDLLHSGVITRDSYLIVIAAFLYYMVLVETAIKIHEFKREDDDYHALAHTHMLLGKYVQGLKLLSQVRAANAGTHSLNIAGYVGVGDMRKAQESARLVIQLGQSKTATQDETYLLMLNAASIYAIPETLLLGVFKQALDAGISDVRLQSTLLTLMATARPAALYAAIEEHGIQQFPLSAAFLMIELERGKEAAELLAGYTPTDPLADFVRRFILLAAQFSSDFTSADDDRQGFEAWCEQELPKAAVLVDNATEDWEKVGVLGIVEQLKRFAEHVVPHRQQQIEYVATDLRRKLEKASQETLAVIKRLDRYTGAAAS